MNPKIRLLPLAGRFSRRRHFSSSCSPSFVRIVEVGPRDGLQNEKNVVPTDLKVNFINSLSSTGLQTIEATAFVSPKWVPQMSDHMEIMQKIERKKNISYPVLIPNLQGLHAALKVNVQEIAVFASASETFSQRNINCSIEESFHSRFLPLMNLATEHKIKIRGYVSCVVGCPYEGMIQPVQVAKVATRLLEMGCYEVSLGDTIGIGSPGHIKRLLQELLPIIPSSKLAIHCHDTYGQALANILMSLDFGLAVVDSSVAGLGGCPYAQGATGNVATEDVIYMLHGLGVETGVDLDKLCEIGEHISTTLMRRNNSRVSLATAAKRRNKI